MNIVIRRPTSVPVVQQVQAPQPVQAVDPVKVNRPIIVIKKPVVSVTTPPPVEVVTNDKPMFSEQELKELQDLKDSLSSPPEKVPLTPALKKAMRSVKSEATMSTPNKTLPLWADALAHNLLDELLKIDTAFELIVENNFRFDIVADKGWCRITGVCEAESNIGIVILCRNFYGEKMSPTMTISYVDKSNVGYLVGAVQLAYSLCKVRGE